MKSPGKKIFVTGGNGFIGSRTVAELVERGYRVRCLLREQSDISRIQHLPFEIQRGDIRDQSSLREGIKGCDAVIHLAGISSWEQIKKEAQNLEAVIVEGTRNVLEVVREIPSMRTVVVSSAAAINASKKVKVFHEKSAYRLGNSSLKYSVAKRKAEKVVSEYVKNKGIDAVIVNPCEVYGPDDIGLVTAGNLIPLLGTLPALVCQGGTSVAHVDDVARGIVLALENGKKGERYILGGENLTLAEIAQLVRELAGRSNQVITLPNFFVKQLCQSMAFAGLDPPLSPDLFEYARLYWFVDSTKAKRELGYKSRPARDVFAGVVKWLIDSKRVAGQASLRYGGGRFDPRIAMMRVFGFLQGKKIVILSSNPKLCSDVLASSDTKGTFLETLFATPAWNPVYSIESVDGDRWKQLSEDFKKLMSQIDWRDRLTPLTLKHSTSLVERLLTDSSEVLGSELISRLVLRILFELIFEKQINQDDETLFFQASLEWRKEIAIKGKADERIKSLFLTHLSEHLALSRFKDSFKLFKSDSLGFLSIFAQPFLISPQINVSDIFVTVFQYLERDAQMTKLARSWALKGDKARLGGILQESIRLAHPFPILERELQKDLTFDGKHYAAGTQFFILMDQLEQDRDFDPERWLLAPADNPYFSIPFAAGPRMCTGKPIAMEMMVEILRILLVRLPMDKIQPQRGHLYSGRYNDASSSKVESRYQTQVFLRGLWKSFLIGRGRFQGLSPVHASDSAAKCPFGH